MSNALSSVSSVVLDVLGSASAAELAQLALEAERVAFLASFLSAAPAPCDPMSDAEDAFYQAKEDASWREYQADLDAGFYAAA